MKRAVGKWMIWAVLVTCSPVLWALPDTYRQGYDKGFADGQQAAESDRAERRAFDFANKELYQRASNGMDTSQHDPEVYRLAYQRGFEDGYEIGYGLSRAKRPAPSASAATSPPERASSLSRDDRTRIPAGTELAVRLLDTLSTQRNERGDPFRVELMEDLRIGEETVIPKNTRIYGIVSALKRPGRIRGRAEMSLEFEEVELPDGSRASITATVVSLEERADENVKDDEGTIQGTGSKGSDAKRVGGSAGVGALVGVLTGGGTGAKIGAAAGAVAGLAGVLATRGSDIILPSETEMSIRLDRDVYLPNGLLRAHP